MNFKNSYFIIENDISNTNIHLLFATRTGSIMRLKNEHAKYFKNGQYDRLPLKVFHDLVSIKALVPEDDNELKSILTENEEALLSSKELSIVLQPGASCQLGCHYCGQTHTKDYLPNRLIDKIVERIFIKMRDRGLAKLKVTWYGGEPLMALKEIRSISSILIDTCAKKSIAYEATMVTNGLSLKKTIFKELVEKCKITNYQITLDGTSRYHDRSRYLKNSKRGSFNSIFANLLSVVAANASYKEKANITVRCNVSKTNVMGISDFINLLYKNNLQSKIGFYLVPIHDWGHNNAEKKNGVNDNDFCKLEIEWMVSLLNKGFYVDILPSRKKIVCSAISANSEVYDAFGNISKCWEVPYTPMYKNTEYVIGNLDSSEAESNDTTLEKWHESIQNNEFPCSDCRLLPVCGGECPIHWKNGTVACPSFKKNIQERMLLKYLLHKKSEA